ncbi:MAG TPA: amidohydrolase family protein [Solirubrobacteraceae bacterium]|nr:amidohydrolase family protein [Solirubrobacteraceae bacterium]
MRIDAHAHVIVPELLRDAAGREAWRPRVWWEDGVQLVELGGRTIRAAVREFVAADAILAEQEAAGIDHVVLCPWVNLLGYDAEPAAGLERCRMQNAGLAALRAAHPERVSVLAAVPLQDPDLAAGELEAVMASGAFAGVEIAASVRGAYLGDDRLEPFWAAAEMTGALVFVHPSTRGFADPVFDDYYLWNLVGNPMETTIAGAHLVLAGVLERHPRLRVLLAHGGGALPALRGRLRHGASFQPQARARLTEPVEDSLRRLYYDTLTHDPGLLRELVAFAGAEHVLLGSDYPFDMADARPADTVAAAALDPDDEQAVLGRSAARLLGLETRA